MEMPTAALRLMKLCINMYLKKPIEYQGHWSKVKVTCFFSVCMILLERVGLDSRNVAQAWPRAVFSLEQGFLTFLFHLVLLQYFIQCPL